MRIRTRMCTSLDGFVTTPQGWPAQLADPGFSPEAYGFVEFQQTISCRCCSGAERGSPPRSAPTPDCG